VSEPTKSYDRKAVVAWSLFDFANSSFTTLVVTFIYATYFTQAMAENEVVGTELWSRAVTVTALAVALASPFVGAVADRGGYRKRFLLVSTVVCIGATIILYFAEPGQIALALVTFTVANIAFEMGHVFYNAFLPDIAPPGQIGRISGFGWGLGYVGGLLCLVVALLAFVYPETPLFGFSTENGANIRATNLLVAAWFALFCIPTFLFVPERKSAPAVDAHGLLRGASRQLIATFHEVRRFRQVVRLLVAHLVYNDGLVTIFAFGGIYAAGTFGFTFTEITIFGIALNVAAGLGAFAFGYLDDLLGGRRTIMISLVGLFGAALLALLTTSTTMFWVAGICVGLLSGPNQSASRSLLGRFVPAGKENEFYGFFAFSGKATAFLGPLLFGLLTGAFGTQRAGLSAVLAFFFFGALILLTVDEQEGISVARGSIDASSAEPS
jgi:MFS transporter, UMF1 family